MKFTLTIGFVALVSFTIGYLLKPSPEIKSEDPEIQVITVDRPIDQRCDDQLKKAEEFYGKAFVLFLANLGIRLSSQQKQQIDQILSNPSSYIKDSDNKMAKPIVLKSQTTSLEKTVPVKELPPNDLPFIEDETLAKDTEKLRLKDPALTYARSKYIKDYSKLKKYNGLYSGKLYFIKGKRKGEVHNIDLNVDFQMASKNDDKETSEGSFQMKLSYNGYTYSNSNNNGDNGSIRYLKNMTILEAGPGMFFNLSSDDYTAANYYENNKLVGLARLTRVDK